MNEPRSVKERITQYVLAHPGDSFNIESLVRLLGSQYRVQVENAVKELRKRDGVFRPLILKDSFKAGYYRMNPDYRTPEQLREEALAIGKERVAQAGNFDPTQPAIRAGEHQSLPTRRLFFRSILERMAKSPSFSAADIELLKTELPNLLTENGGTQV